ncbi:MAG: tetratricopeptide repeat protein, partial [Chloroflexota bacterium]
AGRFVDGVAALNEVAKTYGYSPGTEPREPDATGDPASSRGRAAEDSVERVNAVLSLMDEHESEHTRGIVYLAYAFYLTMRNRPQERLIVTERAVSLARRLNDDVLLAQALQGRGMALFMVGRRDEAFAAAHEALQLCEARGDLGLLSEVLVDLVFVHVHRGEFGLGNHYNDRSLEIAEAVGDTYAAAWAFERRAWIAKQTGDWESARADLARVLQLAPELAHDPWVDCMRGELCLVRGDWDDATAFLEQAIVDAASATMSVSAGLVPAQVCAHGFLAELDLLQGHPAAALARVNAAMEEDQGEYTPILLNWAALAYLQLGEVDQAESASQQAIRGAIEA